uniref:Uncharacterized protein n=1 Tax=Glossina brevipalpis TaxID=37001 RepID=A0A1A9WIB0_9MUSC
MQYSSRSENYSSSLRDSPSKWSSGKESKGYAYKTASYQYASTGSSGGSNTYLDKSVDKNIDQLDALLEDLKNERQITRERDHSLNYRTLERSSYEDPVAGTVTKSTRVIKTGNIQPTLDDAELLPTSNYSTLRSNGSLVQGNDYQTLDKSYGSRNLSPGGFYEAKKTQVYESNRSLNRPMEIMPVATTTTTTNASATQMEKDLESIALTEDILPVPGTKVTTTVRTYTYEIPANAPTTNTLTRKNLIYNNMQTNEMNNVVQPHPVHAIPPTVIYNTESYSTLHKGQEKPIFTNQSYESREHYETNTMRSTNALPPAPVTHLRNPPPGETTIVYNINNTTTTTNRDGSNYPHSPKQGPNIPPYGGPHSPRTPHGPTMQRYIYNESTNTVNTIHSPGGPSHEPLLVPKRAGTPGLPNAGGYPPTANPPNVTYKYSSTTTNSRRGPDYGTPSPTLPPAPFPLDGGEFPVGNANPPQRVEDLMQSLGNQVDVVDKADLSTPRKREIETAVATSNQQQIIPSVNRAGKEVYYPPGHEMMLTKREEMAAGSAGGGRWAKASGMYEYESGYKSKTKTKSGAAMVPVCLPLCCAMPCTIM